METTSSLACFFFFAVHLSPLVLRSPNLEVLKHRITAHQAQMPSSFAIQKGVAPTGGSGEWGMGVGGGGLTGMYPKRGKEQICWTVAQ